MSSKNQVGGNTHMRRLSLSTKLFAAALPLLIAVGALLALTVRSDLNDVNRAQRGADLGAVWDPLITALVSIEAELVDVNTAGDPSVITADTTIDAERAARVVANRRATDQAVNDVAESLTNLGAAKAAGEHITASRSQLSAARGSIDMSQMSTAVADTNPLTSYDLALRELVSIGQLLPAESDDSTLGRELLAVVKLAEARVASDAVITNINTWLANPSDTTPLATAQVRFTELESVMGEFAAVAPDEWSTQYRQAGFVTSLSRFRSELNRAFRSAANQEPATFDVAGFETVANQGLTLQSEISQSIVDRADAQVSSTQKAALVRIGIILGAVLLALLIAWMLTRSITRRVKAVSRSANQVASVQLPALVEALRDPRGRSAIPDIEPVNARGSDELAELAQAFNSMQETLVEVAQQQVEVLRRGVSEIFVTMARRNRSLIDRQLAMLDEYEASVDDPEVLGNYYQLDHLATRMRRNSESLLVLANAEPKRRRVKATEIDDVVRASIGEVEDYRRVEVESLESLQVRGSVVADVSHMLAELLDNATSFSPPESIVRVGGRRAGESYMIRIVDNGVGIATERMKELNELLRDPPIVGLSVEPTLGISVVSLLANKHGIEVTLSAGSPGLTVDVLLPSALFGPIDVPNSGNASGSKANHSVPTVAEIEQIVAWNDTESDPSFESIIADESFEQATEYDPYDRSNDYVAPQPAASDQPTAFSNWTSTVHDASPFPSGQHTTTQHTATQHTDEYEYDHAPVAYGADLSEPEIRQAEVRQQEVLQAEIRQPEIDLAVAAPVSLAVPSLPPPAAVARVSGEFARPPAPPIMASSPSSHPVTPDHARPVPTPRTLEPVAGLGLNLPVRSPSAGPEGPDRLAAVDSSTDESRVGQTSTPSALQAALAAFDSGRNGNGNGALPTRARVTDPVAAGQFEEQTSVAQSRLDPEALRERLRAFQSEFRTGASHPHDSDSNTQSHGSQTLSQTTSQTTGHSNNDLGGDHQ